jgi:hypothetical protein
MHPKKYGTVKIQKNIYTISSQRGIYDSKAKYKIYSKLNAKE